jgi:transposase
MNAIASDEYEFVIGVDTHVATHSFTVVAAATGAAVDQAASPTSTGGLSRGRAGWSGALAARRRSSSLKAPDRSARS